MIAASEFLDPTLGLIAAAVLWAGWWFEVARCRRVALRRARKFNK